MKTKSILFAMLALALACVSCKDDREEESTKEEPKVVEKREVQQKQRDQKPLTQEQRNNSNSVMVKLMRDKDMAEFSRALVAAGMLTKLGDLNTEYTILAPSNEAFKGLQRGQNVVSDISRREELTDMLSMHIIKGSVSSVDMVQKIQKDAKISLTTISGKKLIATMKGDSILITNNATEKSLVLGKSDIQGTNGVLHSVNGFFQ